jgi:tetratricopeptide (TPR) repeat protein
MIRSGKYYIVILFRFVLLVFVFSTVSFAETDPSALFEEANKAYMAKDYKSAINLYEEILRNDYESTALYYNLGNAYYRTGSIGYAILYYEKALKLSPNDEDVKHNLLLANLRTVDRIDTLPEFFIFKWWEGILNFFTLKEWLNVILFFYFMLLILAGFYFFADSPSKQKTAVFGSAISILLLAFTVSLFIVKFNREVNEKTGVIVADSLPVLLAPENSAGEAFIVHEGLKIKIEDKVNEWTKIRLIDGKIGWVKTREIKVI